MKKKTIIPITSSDELYRFLLGLHKLYPNKSIAVLYSDISYNRYNDTIPEKIDNVSFMTNRRAINDHDIIVTVDRSLGTTLPVYEVKTILPVNGDFSESIIPLQYTTIENANRINKIYEEYPMFLTNKWLIK